MTRSSAVEAILGGGDIVTGVTWVPEDALLEWAGTRASSLPGALALLAEEAALDFAFVPASACWALEGVSALHDSGADAFWVADGPFGRVAAAKGWSQSIQMTAEEPAALAAALDRALHECLLDVRRGRGAGADVLVVADDLAGGSGMLVSPDYALEALLPVYAHVAAEARSLGMPAMFHSDGDVRVLYSALAKAGFSAVHVADSDVLRAAGSARAAVAAGLVAVGGIARQRLHGQSAVGSTAEAATDVASRGAVLADDGGISSAGELRDFIAAVRLSREGRARRDS